MKFAGEFAGLATALCWTVTAMSFQLATRRVGSLAVNIIRLVFAFIFYVIYTKIFMGSWWPTGASTHAWIYLSISGLIGFVLGDFFLFKSYEFVSSKISMLIMTLAPPIAAIMAWFVMDEGFSLMNILGMALVIAGVVLVIIKKENIDGENQYKYPIKGVLFALGGAIGQGVGAVFSKIGMGNYDPFASSQIRVITGVLGFSILITFMKKWKNVRIAIKDKKANKALLLGALFGPFLGVSLGMVAFQNTSVGIASTLMATVPVFILLPTALIFKEKLTLREVFGAILSVLGIAIFFIT